MRCTIYASLAVLLAACASTAVPVPQGKGMASIHELEILVLADPRLLHVDAPEPDYDAAPDIMTGYRLKQDYEARIAAGVQALTPELTYANTRGALTELLRAALAKAGVKVKSVRLQPYSGSLHDERELEDRASSAPRGSALLVLVPTIALSEDYRSLHLSAKVQVYPRESTIPALDQLFSVSSTPLDGVDPVGQWSAAGGDRFFHELNTDGATLGGKLAASFGAHAP